MSTTGTGQLAAEVRAFVVRPVLVRLRMWSQAAENLMVGTGLIESGFHALRQRPGPALSWWQIEPATFHDVYERYLFHVQPDLMGRVNAFRLEGISGALAQLPGNQHFACAIARVRYWMVPKPLPHHDDTEGLAAYWKAHYNTERGDGDPAKWAAWYRRHGEQGSS